MITLISPSKTLDFESIPPIESYTDCLFLFESQKLNKILKKMNKESIKELMGVSDKIADLNFNRFKDWNVPFNLNNAKQAIYAFKGDVYSGLDAYSLNNNQINFAQNNLRILSGLYGVLKPLDLIMPYRLEMGTKLKNGKGNNLYQYWGDSITNSLKNEMIKNKYSYVINLASNEYFKSVNLKFLKYSVITPLFKENRNGEFKMIAIYAKKARGLMARYIIDNELNEHEDLKNFNIDGYKFNDEISSNLNYVFTR